MALHFILGRAGSGKTAYCINQIAEDLKKSPLGDPLIMVVPDQASLINEMTLAAYPGLGGSIRGEILSFGRLVHKIKKDEPWANLPWLDDMGKAMLISQSLKKHLGKLSVFKKAARHSGFVANLLNIIKEMERYQIEPKAVFEAAFLLKKEDKRSLTSDKLNDIALIYEELMHIIGKDYLDESTSLSLAAQAIPNKNWLKNAKVWLEGFTDFNPAQMKVIESLLKNCAEVYIGFCLEPKLIKQTELKEDNIFANTWQSHKILLHLAEKNGIPVEYINLQAGKRYSQSSDLAVVEKAFAFADYTACAEAKNIYIIKNNDKEAEIRCIAGKIVNLCRNCGYRQKDIALVLRNSADYESLLPEIFQEYSLSCFMDIPRPLIYHPVAELIGAALQVISEDWQHEAVFRYLKCGLIPVEDEEVDILENYCLACGIRSSSWKKAEPWSKYYSKNKNEDTAQNLETVNQIRFKAVRALKKFADKLKNEPTVTLICQSLLELLTDLDVETTLKKQAETLRLAGEMIKAEENDYILKGIVNMIGEISYFLGEDKLSFENLAEILASGFSKLETRLIPPVLDEIFVSDIAKSRTPDAKAVFVMGANDGVFPARVVEDSLLNSSERDMLPNYGIKLAPSQRKQQLEENYLIYLALSRSSEKLYVSYVANDDDGQSLEPSLFVNNLLALFPNLTVEEGGKQVITGGKAGLNYLREALLNFKEGKTESVELRQIYNYFKELPEYAYELGKIVQGIYYKPNQNPLSKAKVQALYGNMQTSSISRLESFNYCPCRYFANYGLKLKPRQEYKVKVPDIGTIYHEILATVLAELTHAETEWSLVNKAMLKTLVEQAVENLSDPKLGGILAADGKNRYIKIKMINVAVNALMDITTQLALGKFVPVAWEAYFGEGAPIEGLSVALNNEKSIGLHGFIDRIDKAEIGDTAYYRIIDYKMAQRDLNPVDIYNGINWQMPVYLQAVLNDAAKKYAKEAKPAGMFYSSVRENIQLVNEPDYYTKPYQNLKLKGLALLTPESIALAEAIESGNGKVMPVYIKKDGSFGKNSGISEQDYQIIQKFLYKQIQNTLNAVMAGVAAPKPLFYGDMLACDNCDYNALCATEKTADLPMADKPELSNEEAIAAMAEAAGGEVDE